MGSMRTRGQVMLPMALALAVLALASFGVWGVLRHWRHLVETQLRLDRCVGETALRLRDTVRRVESSNREMRILRESIAAALLTLNTEAIPPLRLALEAELSRQELGRAR